MQGSAIISRRGEGRLKKCGRTFESVGYVHPMTGPFRPCESQNVNQKRLQSIERKNESDNKEQHGLVWMRSFNVGEFELKSVSNLL